MVKGAEGCSRTGIFNGKPDCKKVSGEGRTYGIFSDHHRRGIRSYTASRMEKSIRRRVLRLEQIRYRRMAWRILITESVPLPMPD